MTILERIRSPRLSFAQTAASLALGAAALASSYWCEGRQKVPKPLCSPTKRRHCVPVPGLAAGNGSATDPDPQFSWDTGDDRFVFPAFHVGLFYCCEENIYTDAWGEEDTPPPPPKKNHDHTFTPFLCRLFPPIFFSAQLVKNVSFFARFSTF